MKTAKNATDSCKITERFGARGFVRLPIVRNCFRRFFALPVPLNLNRNGGCGCWRAVALGVRWSGLGDGGRHG